MYIKEVLSQHRRDFQAIYRCDHCGDEVKGSGYDDHYFHNNVVPKMECASCGMVAGDSCGIREPKYGAHEQI